MDVQIRHDAYVQGDKNEWITTTVQGVLARFGEQITTVEVHLADEDGPKTSDGALRCTLEVRAAGFSPIAASAHGSDIPSALDAALHKVERMLDGQLARARDHHPGRSS
jgi:ribosome-associated translation inhibitor RaiA